MVLDKVIKSIMVKNKTGGKNAKKGARKNIVVSMEPRKLRFANNDEEHYAIVKKMLGNGQMIVLCDDNKERLCTIRYKFSGRNKSSNFIANGGWCIVGLRSWETVKADKLEKCDLLEIYTHPERTKMIQECKTNLDVLLKEELGSLHDNADNCDILFSNESESTKNDANITCNGVDTSMNFDDDEIDFDDI